ncbi:hypothetical protein HYY75_02935, partial [bacterium]|nr:hypothetical protein [bacterium]
VEVVGGTPRIDLEDAFTQGDLNMDGFSVLKMFIPPGKAKRETYLELSKIMKKTPGVCNFTLEIQISPKEWVTLKPPPNFKVNLCSSLIKDWENICGNGTVTAQFPKISWGNSRKRFKDEG